MRECDFIYSLVTPPPPVKWPWEHVADPPTPWFVAACICEDGWLPEPQGKTMVACYICNVELVL